MKVVSRNKKMISYPTWYVFKKEVEERIRHSLLNWDWLEVKPKAPLPWDESHMGVTLSVLTSLEGRKKISSQTTVDTHRI